MNISKHTLYFNVIFNNSDSLPTCFTAAVAIAIDCGEINFAATPPTVLADTRSEPLVPIYCATEAWIGANNELLFTTDPVINTPIQPKIGDRTGKTLPALAIPWPIAALKPP